MTHLTPYATTSPIAAPPQREPHATYPCIHSHVARCDDEQELKRAGEAVLADASRFDGADAMHGAQCNRGRDHAVDLDDSWSHLVRTSRALDLLLGLQLAG